MVEAVAVQGTEQLKTCTFCGKEIVGTLFEVDTLRAAEGDVGSCMDCVFKRNFEYMGSLGVQRRGDKSKTVVVRASFKGR